MTHAGESKGFDPREERAESGHGVCWDIPEPVGTCAWNNFYSAAATGGSYNFFFHNCHNAVDDAVDRCTVCKPPQIQPFRCKGGPNCFDTK